MNFEFPHIRFVSPLDDNESYDLLYLGGESSENEQFLVLGQKYRIGRALYSPDRGTDRVLVWTCSIKNEDYKFKYLCVDINNFGTIDQLRDKKIQTIIHNH